MSKKKTEPDVYRHILNEAKGYYFEAYSQLDAHENMIKDSARTMAYQRAIEMNSHLFKDKIVMDVGCGLGILSLFAASAGAKLVIGIDASDIAHHAKAVVQANNFDNIIIIHSKVEELTELPDGVEKVDIIISEWMGICLYHESMLATVLYARDKWLKPKGLMFPDRVQLFLGTTDDTEKVSRIDRWSYVYGFDMSALQNVLYEEASLDSVNPDRIPTDYYKLNEINLYTAKPNFSFTTRYTLTANRDCRVCGFFTYFDAIFSKCHKTVILSTSPHTELTHWRQTVFPLKDTLGLQKDDEITGTFSLEPYKYNFRDLGFRINVNVSGRTAEYHFTSQFVLR